MTLNVKKDAAKLFRSVDCNMPLDDHDSDNRKFCISLCEKALIQRHNQTLDDAMQALSDPRVWPSEPKLWRELVLNILLTLKEPIA